MRVTDVQAMSAEKSVLGAMMLDVPALKLGIGRLTPADFINEANRVIFKAMVKLDGEGKPVDYMTLLDEVDGNPALERFDGGALSYLMDVAKWVPSAVNVEAYIVMCQENAREARIAAALDGIRHSELPTLTLLEGLVEREKAAIKPIGGDNDPLTVVADYLDDICEPAEMTLFTTGLPTLDTDMGGLPRGSLSIIAARPRIGKTTLALNFMVHNIRSKHKTLFCSLEMTRRQILDRIAAMTTKTPYQIIHKRMLSDGHKRAICTELPELANDNRLNITDTVNSINGIISEIERIRPDIVFIDYCQRITPDRNTESRHHDIESVIYRLKQAAIRYDCHVCLLSQISRAGADQPRLEHLKESGSLEEGGDIIMILHRPDAEGQRIPGERAELLIEKHKYGECGFLELYFDGKTQRFTESAKEARG